MTAVPPSEPLLTARQINRRIFPVVFFTFICYLSIGIPLAILPGFTHNLLGFGSVMAGFTISLQYFATLASRPWAGRCADRFGAKKVVLLGLSCCGLSGAITMVAATVSHLPLFSLGLLFIGRLILGVGESFASTGSMLWAIGRVGRMHTGRVISWNGVATYGAIAIGAPLGVWLNAQGGLVLSGAFVFIIGLVAVLVARAKAGVAAVAGQRLPLRSVVGKVWLYGLILGLGTIGFGVIVSFITLFYAEHGWNGAALALTLMSSAFVGIRLVSGNSISRFGGLRVSLVSFAVEACGLLVIWAAPTPVWAALGALLTGAGFSLVFPALGVEAVKRVAPQSQGTALGTYSAFLDLGLGIAGPAAGFIMAHLGMSWIYLCAALMTLCALLVTLRLLIAAQPAPEH